MKRKHLLKRVKLLSLPLRRIALLLVALNTPAFGGRMNDFTSPAEIRPVTEPEATEAPLTEEAIDDDELGLDSDMMAEEAEGAGDDMGVEASPALPPSRWKWTRSLSIGVSADDNINFSSVHKESDQILTLNGNFGLLWGLKKEESYLAIDYTPTVLVFQDHNGANSFDQKAGLSGQWRLAKLTMEAQAGAQTFSGGDVDVGDRAKRILWQISLHGKYDYSTKTSLEVNLSSNASNYSKYLDSIEWVNSNWIDYQVFPKTRIGAGLTLGYLKAEGSSAQTYQQALLRITTPASGKLTISASGGIEFRQLGSSGGTETTPVFRLGASYHPFDGTEISAEASRRIYSSAAMSAENFTATGGAASVRQRVFRRYFVTVSGGYEDARYESTGGAAGSARHDQYLFVRPSLSFALTKWMNLELYYQYRRNTSTAAFSGFDSNVAGVQAAVNF